MVRKRDDIYWDMFGYDTEFKTYAGVAADATKKIDNVASGRIAMGGDILIRPVFADELMFSLRTETRLGTGITYLTALKWEKFGTRIKQQWDVSAETNEAKSMVSFGAEGVVI